MERFLCIIKSGKEAALPEEAICAALLYELAKQEAETNEGYAMAFSYIQEHGGVLAEKAAEIGAEIMGDESNHISKAKALANAFAGIAEPQD